MNTSKRIPLPDATEEDTKPVIPERAYHFVITRDARRLLRFGRFGGTLAMLMLVAALRPVAPLWFAVMVGVLAGVGLYGIFRELIFLGCYRAEGDR